LHKYISEMLPRSRTEKNALELFFIQK